MGLPDAITFVPLAYSATFFSVFMTGDKFVSQQENINWNEIFREIWQWAVVQVADRNFRLLKSVLI
jgi:hypothetical protein